MIRVRRLVKTFRCKKQVVEAVKGIDVDVRTGELVAFLGPNGAGKSTTLRMLTSLLTPTSGSAEVAGYDIVRDPARVRARIGYVGQGNGGGYSYRVRDELHSQGRFYGLPRAQYVPRADELLAALDLGAHGDRAVRSLSGGQLRRLDVALGLMNRPPLLFLDEPTTGLDPQSRANLWEHITTMRQASEMTVVLTTHYLDEADTMAERVIVIDHGEIIADASPDQLKRDHADDIITITLRGTDPRRVQAALPTTVGTVTVAHGGEGLLTVTVGTHQGALRLPEAIETLRLAGMTATSVDLKRASLDDVFLALTGRSLREEAA